MWGGYDREDVRGTLCLHLSLKEVVTHGATDDTMPVLLHKDLPVHTHRNKVWILNMCSKAYRPPPLQTYKMSTSL